MTNSQSEQVSNFLSRLDGVKRAGSGWQARCPCRNDDQNPSLSIGQGNDGRVLVTCHRGNSCNVEQICSAVGMRVSDLMPPREAQQQPKREKLKLVKTYDYLDAEGNLLFQKLRYIDESGKKTFKQRKPSDDGQWVYSLGDIPKVLYNLPAVLRARSMGAPIWVVEGEKDVDTLTDMGIVATTMPGGAGKWLDIHTEALSGATVEIIADNDEVGLKHAKDVFSKLNNAGCNAAVWVCPNHKDITDHLDAGLPLDELNELPQQENPDVEGELQVVEEKSAEQLLIEKINDVLSRSDLNEKQKLAKSSLIIATSTATGINDPGRLVQWNDFVQESDEDNYDWVIPGLLERGERVIVVAAEGVGKTMLARQVAICSSAGINPFTYQGMKPITTLTVDLENPERIIRRTSRKIIAQAMAHGHAQRLGAHVLTKPSGMDLLRATDRMILEDAIEKIKPDMILIGPLYKSFIDPGGRTPESIAVEIAKYLDTIRTVYNCCLWIEHHAPLGASMSTRDLRPFGSAVWSRWPEFGLSLQPDPTADGAFVYDVKHFRGARDERQWPLKMKRGKRFPFEVLEFTKLNT